ncbi:cytochrome c biogenesis heme-transporting ATPase CcmA [Natronospira bacteriovora]|uniref:Cytochrome c biogenesis heme-transporting ATPase CcmA n=1 Tax=Natronospira bacteriovora TaxID=3069753 RepID=A0ABU0W9M8_9GAMM|nr:cytochrome c biogenesis heme-transporting ATPase CcmA [Natronospira sp. AB-CW4]MDQ2070751.1 cytochrome c biogenesis heme-transporting ATPase CcmA [Natronospira sp. AB-CW4]
MSEITAQPQNASQTAFRLSASDLEIWRGETLLLNGFSCHVDAGELVWLRGPNGAGKTTLMRILLGLSHPEAGQISWCGRDIREARADFLADAAWCGHQPGLRPELTPHENLAAWLPLCGRPSGRRIEEALALVGLGDRQAQPCHSLSAGQVRRAGLARLLLSEARLWCLDEPLTSLDAEGQTLVARLLADHCRQGGAALVSSHQALPESAGPIRELRIGREGTQ